ncbi:unnamed protein product, partial [Meganyctiphanes norvegica]
ELWPKKTDVLMKMLVKEEPNPWPYLIEWVDDSRYIFILEPIEMLTQISDPSPDKTSYNYAHFLTSIRHHVYRRGLIPVRNHQHMFVCGPKLIEYMNKVKSP